MSGSSFSIASLSFLVVLAGLVPAQGAPPLEPEGRAAEVASLRPFVLEGFVFDADGAPAAGAVVVSSSGGRAITRWNGSYRFEARVPLDAQSVQVTAVGGVGSNLVASTRVAFFAGSGAAQVDPLLLVDGDTCEPSWLPTFGGQPGTDDRVDALAVYDDGSGPSLFVGGGFSFAGGRAVDYIARWDGSSWAAVGGGMNDEVHSLAVFDAGAGPGLYAGGEFTIAGGVSARRIARWDGSSWAPLGNGVKGGGGGTPTVNALAVFDDGSGPALFVGGSFADAGVVTGANNLAKWTGSSWAGLGSGMTTTPAALTIVHALATFDDGGGSALYAGGTFTHAGGVFAPRVAKWNGSSWAALGSGMNAPVHSLAGHDDGGGSALYAGGTFTLAGGVAANRIARWNGSSWADVSGGLSAASQVPALTLYDDGSGAALYAAYFTGGFDPTFNVAKWDGSSWSTFSSGMSSFVNAMTVHDDGSGPALFAGGLFETAGGVVASRIAKWDASSWSALGHGMYGSVLAMTVYDDGSGPALHAGGTLTSASGVAASKIAKWDGTVWSTLGSGIAHAPPYPPTVYALTVHDDGGGPALYAGGNFTDAGGLANNIAKWDGSSWSALGTGLTGQTSNDSAAVWALAVFDDGGGPALYAGGTFTVAGGAAANFIAKWDGSSWSALGSGMFGGGSTRVLALTVFDDGGGPALHAGGFFAFAGGVPANRIAKWDGSSWAALGSGIGNPTLGYSCGEGSTTHPCPHAFSLVTHDDGNGVALYAGGGFTSAGGIPVNNVAKWDGSSWTALGSGLDGLVDALAVHDDGSGPALYAAGNFVTAGGLAVNRIAKWDGSSWTALGGGLSGLVSSLAVYDDGNGPALHAGGAFSSAFDSGDSFLARWSCPLVRVQTKVRRR